ncbi:zinc finger protein 576-like [Vidua macroura]|uniref:zinc finger protein 576-like n=1 Tax=Vidua macroura TaxID=187451 RepID=UPI0023A82314|nr:zinc finger protein 576-like [Vidua macroura]
MGRPVSPPPQTGPGSRRCGRCLITFPDAAFAARHAKRQHPRAFAAAALRGALFVCFVCARAFASSPALLRHQRGHAPRPASRHAPSRRRTRPPRAPPRRGDTPPLSCTECGRGFAREGGAATAITSGTRGGEL